MPRPSILCVKDEWEKNKWDNMPLPKKKIGTWQEQSKPNLLQNQPLKAYMPIEKLPLPSSLARKWQMREGEAEGNDQVVVAPPKIVTQEDEARPAQVAVAPAKNEMIEFDYVDLEEEMVQMPITMETKLKKVRLKKIEMRRREDEEKENQKFLE